jgi:hypothetical protein
MSDEIIRHAVIAKAGNNVRLERRDQRQIEILFVLLLGKEEAICC